MKHKFDVLVLIAAMMMMMMLSSTYDSIQVICHVFFTLLSIRSVLFSVLFVATLFHYMHSLKTTRRPRPICLVSHPSCHSL